MKLKSKQTRDAQVLAQAQAQAQAQGQIQPQVQAQTQAQDASQQEHIMADVYSVAFAEGVMMFQPSKGAKQNNSSKRGDESASGANSSFATVVEAAYRKTKQGDDPDDINSRISGATKWKLLSLASKAKHRASSRPEGEEGTERKDEFWNCAGPGEGPNTESSQRQNMVRFASETLQDRGTKSEDTLDHSGAELQKDAPAGHDETTHRSDRHQHRHKSHHAHHHQGHEPRVSRHRHRKDEAHGKAKEDHRTDRSHKGKERSASSDPKKRVGRILDEDAEERVKLAIKKAKEELEASGQPVPETPNDWDSEDEAEFERQERERLLRRQTRHAQAQTKQQQKQQQHYQDMHHDDASHSHQHKHAHNKHHHSQHHRAPHDQPRKEKDAADKHISQQITDEMNFGVSAWGTLPAAGVW